MGSTQAKQSSGNDTLMQIVLEKNIFFPGECIRGSIQLKSNKTLKLGQILYQVKQTEYWNFQKTQTKSINKTNQNPIINLLLNYPNLTNISLSKGVSIPFSIQLPSYVIPSLEYSLVDKQAFIRNELHVRIDELNVFAGIYIIIKKPAMVLNSPLTINSTSNTKLFGIGFLNQGSVILEGVYPTNNFAFFSCIPLQITLKSSSSKIKVKKLNVKMLRRVKFLDHVKEDKNLIWEEVLFNTTQGITSKDTTYNFNIQVIEPENIFNRYALGNTGMNITDKRQIINFLPSVTSGMISCEYFIRAEAEYDSLIPMFKNPILEMPLSITHQSNEQLTQSVNQFHQQFDQNLNQLNGVVDNNYPEAPNMSMVNPAPQVGNQNQYPVQNEPQMFNNAMTDQGYTQPPPDNEYPPSQDQFEKPTENNNNNYPSFS